MSKCRCDAKKLYAVIWLVTSSFGNGLVIKEALSYFRTCLDEEPNNFYANLGIILIGMLLHTPNMLSVLYSWKKEEEQAHTEKKKSKNFLSFIKFILTLVAPSALNAAGFIQMCELLFPSTPLSKRIIGAGICLITSSYGEYIFYLEELDAKQNGFSLWLSEVTNAYNHKDKSLYYCLQQSRRLFLWPILVAAGNFLPGLFAGWELVTAFGIENSIIYHSVGTAIGALAAGLETNKATAKLYENENATFSKAAQAVVWPTAIIIYGLESSLALLMIGSVCELSLWMKIGYFGVVYAALGLPSADSYHKTVIDGVDAQLPFKNNDPKEETQQESIPLLFDTLQKNEPENRYSWWSKFCCCTPKTKVKYLLDDSDEEIEEEMSLTTRAYNFFLNRLS